MNSRVTNHFILCSLRLKAESRARTNSGSESNDGAVRREAGLVLHEIGHHCIRRFPGPDMSAPRLTGALIPAELLCLSSRAKWNGAVSMQVLTCPCFVASQALSILHVFIHRMALGIQLC